VAYRNRVAILIAALLPLAGSAHAGPTRAQVFQQGDWTGHVVYRGSPANPVRCTVGKRADGVALTVIRRLDGNAGVRVAFDPARVNNLGNFAMFVDGQFIRGPASYDEAEGRVTKDFLPWENNITRGILKRFRNGKQVTFDDAGADLPAVSLDGADEALARLDDCAQWRP
jgi:hypothetical protein